MTYQCPVCPEEFPEIIDDSIAAYESMNDFWEHVVGHLPKNSNGFFICWCGVPFLRFGFKIHNKQDPKQCVIHCHATLLGVKP
jgi:hypothetical protein